MCFVFIVVLTIPVVIAVKNVSRVTMVTVFLATVRDAIVMHVVRQVVYVMTLLGNAHVSQGSQVNDAPLVGYVVHFYN